MRPALSSLNGRTFDVAVIGGGAAGASAAQNLAAQGFDVLLVDKGDFASGTSSRSSRLLYCGLAYVSPDHALWRFAYRPRDLFQRVRMARLAMQCRTQLVETMPERLRPRTFFFPVYKDSPFPGWKVDLGYRALGLFGSPKAPLDYRRLPAAEAARRFGLVRLLDGASLDSVGVFREYQYDWAERICIDTVLDAERCGAVLRNHTAVTGLVRRPDGEWRLTLEDGIEAAAPVEVGARMVVNTAGPWADRVNRQAGPQSRDRVVGIKGVNLLVKLPDDCEGLGLETLSSIGQPFYCMPWGRHHFLGPTETVFEGDPDTVRVLPEEREFILAEANRLFPSLRLTSADVVYSWAGVRPRTSSRHKEGVKALTVHDMAEEGMPNALTLTGTPIMLHRRAGADIAARVRRALAPSRAPRPLSHAAKPFPGEQNSPPLDPDEPETRISDLVHAARHEHPQTLIDLLFRRVPIGWSAGMGLTVARRAAEAVAETLGWDEDRIEREVGAYRAFVAEHFAAAALREPEQPSPSRRKVY